MMTSCGQSGYWYLATKTSNQLNTIMGWEDMYNRLFLDWWSTKVIIVECWESNIYFEALPIWTLKFYSYMYNGCGIWYTVNKILHGCVFTHCWSQELLVVTCMSLIQHGRYKWTVWEVFTQIHRKNITNVIYKTENKTTTFGASCQV